MPPSTALRAQGAEVHVVAADISRYEEVERLLKSIAAPLRGVVHAAGVLDDGLLVNQDGARLERVLAGKAAGAWRLHQLTGDLDFFVLFSSAAAVLSPRDRRAMRRPMPFWTAWPRIAAAAGSRR